MLAWHPQHLRNELSEEMIIDAWLLDRLRAGVRLREVGREHDGGRRRTTDKKGRDKGPPIWERDGRPEWMPD